MITPAMQVLGHGLERVILEIQGVLDVLHHHGEASLVMLYGWSAVVQTMHTPASGCNPWYRLLYSLCHLSVGNWKLWAKTKGTDKRGPVTKW